MISPSHPGRSGRHKKHPLEKGFGGLGAAMPVGALEQLPLVESANIGKYQDTIAEYVANVLSGRLVTGVLEQAACQRWIDDWEQKAEKGWRFDWVLAADVADWFASLKHSQGEYYGDPFDLFPIQLFCVANLFGWINEADNIRRFNEFFYTVARGNGKTPLGAGLILRLCGYDRPRMHRLPCYFAATKLKQAKIGYSDIGGFVYSTGLQDQIIVQKELIRFPEHDSTIEALCSDGLKADGLRIYALLKDEIHAWLELQRDFHNRLEGGLGKFPQCLKITTTTAGNENSVIWQEEYNRARAAVERGNAYEVDNLFAMICEIDDDDDPLDVANLPKANPLMRHGIVKEKFLHQQIEKAKINPQEKATLKRFHCNKYTESVYKAFTSEMWDCGRGELPDGYLENTPSAGVDLGWCDDLASVGYCYPAGWKEVESEQKPMYVIDADVFIPRGTIRSLEKQPFSGWIERGLLTVTDSEWTDPDVMYQSIEARGTRSGISTIAYDPNNARVFASHCVNELGLTMYGFRQSHAKYTEPIREFKIALTEGRIFHNDHPIIEWCFRNMKEEINSKGHTMPKKPGRENPDAKIDVAVAILMAFSEALFAEPPPALDHYETNPVEIF